MVQDRTPGAILFDVLNHVFLALLGLICLLPLVHVVAVSLSDRAASAGNLVTLWPVRFTTFSYQRIIANVAFQRAFLISTLRVTLGTALNILIVILTAYPLSLAEEFPGKGIFKWVMIFAMLFSGGLIPWYLALRSLGLIDRFAALILPGAVQMWSIIIMLNFFRQLPRELAEAATVDGASHWDILFRVYVPLSLPALATLVLFAAVGHWNAWFDALVVMSSPTRYPLQTYLRMIVVAKDFSAFKRDPEVYKLFSPRSIQAAAIVVATVPILAVYPSLQRYFVSGLTLGSIKG